MEYLFGNYKVDIDVEKTRTFYNQADFITSGCQCDGCCNYEKAVDYFPDQVKSFFAEIGVDLKKAAEIIAYVAENDGKSIYYGGFYHVCGVMMSNTDVWISQWDQENTHLSSLDDDSMYSIAENYKIGFTNKCALIEDNFPAPVLQIEIAFHCPWVLEKENTYG
ncbi:MAG: hypothetical protein K2K10_08635 [Acetatifactor sp.]|nr:hypothetical protein [Acetatifactor sp.]